MPRRKRQLERPAVGDHIYGLTDLRYLQNVVMRSGKLSISIAIVNGALDRLLDHVGFKSTDVAARGERIQALLDELVDKAGPDFEVKSNRIGGATYQVPVPVNASRRTTLAFRKMIEVSRGRTGAMLDKLYEEMKNIIEGRGDTVKWKENMLRMAAANRSNVRGRSAVVMADPSEGKSAS